VARLTDIGKRKADHLDIVLSGPPVIEEAR
jgi:hypothetical protein